MKHVHYMFMKYVYWFWYLQYMLLDSGCSANDMAHNAARDRILGNGE